MKRAARPIISAGRVRLAFVKLHARSHHLGNSEAIFDVIKKGIWKAHSGLGITARFILVEIFYVPSRSPKQF